MLVVTTFKISATVLVVICFYASFVNFSQSSKNELKF